MKIEVFVNKNWKTADKVFTHYWYNEGENFFDSVSQSFDGYHHSEEETFDFVSEYDGYTGPTEAYLEQFKEAGYSWEEIIPTKRQFDDMLSMTIQVDKETIDLLPTMFFRITGFGGDDDTFPLYYYSNGIKGVSDDNIIRRSYQIECKLDMWASCWVYMHHYMKENTDEIDFLQKMCNRFIFNDPVYKWDEEQQKYIRTESTGFIIDYLQQPYLMRSAKYEKQLFVTDTRENFLTLEQFLFINSGKKDLISYEKWLKDYWLKWLENPYVGSFNPLTEITGDSNTAYITTGVGKYQNKYAEKLSDFFYDTDFNSNTKYRYLVCKVGNNTAPNTETSTNYIKGMFHQFKYGVNYIGGSTTVTPEILSTDNWTPYLYTIEKKPFGWYKELDVSGFNLSDDSICIGWDNYLIDDKHFTLNLINNNVDVYTVTWTDDFQLKEHRLVLNAYELNKEYELLTLPAKSYVLDIYGDTIDVNLNVAIKFTSKTSAKLVLRTWFDISFEDLFDANVKVNVSDPVTINTIYLVQSGTVTPSYKTIDGETLMIIPFKKGSNEREYIELLNSTDKGILMGDGSVIGMPVNDIPPSVLAAAIRRQNDESDWQTIGDTLSVRMVDGVQCNLDLVSVKIGGKQIPAVFTDFSYIPITIATAPLPNNIYQCIGGNNFFNEYYEILTKGYLTTNLYRINHETGLWECYSGGNTMFSEPFIRGPQFWEWVYYIDGTHNIKLSGEKIDFKKLVTNRDWEVKLNVNFNGVSNYFLDISDIKNNKYPMSKLGIELISGDPSSYPFTTEAYNNWLQQNQLSQETSKNAKDITNKFAWDRGIVDATIGSAEVGLTATASGMGSLLTAGAAAGFGVAAGSAHSVGAIAGTYLTTKQNTEEFENKWRGELGNYYNAPSQLNPSGFSSGSLVYSPIKSANSNSYELFRTFSAPDILREKVWHDISINGYPFTSQCLYKEYNNRLMFNVVNCNLVDKQYTFMNYLKAKMFDLYPIFSNNEYILSFIEKCQDKFRVFKCEYNEGNMENIIAQNIELEREWCDPYNAPQKSITVDISHEVSDTQDDSWVWDNEYHWTKSDDNVYLLQKTKDSEGFIETIPYASLNVTDFDSFKNTYRNVYLGNKNSYSLLFEKKIGKTEYTAIQDSIATNSADYGPFGINLSEEVSKDINAITSNTKLDNAIKVTLDDNSYISKSYILGWNVALADNGDNTNLKVTLIPISQWRFEETVDITTGTISNNTTTGKIDDIKLVDTGVEPKFPIDYTREYERRAGGMDTDVMTIYRDGTVLNDFIAATPIYYGSNKGVVIGAQSRRAVYEKKYSDLGIDAVQTKADFRKYFNKLSFNVNDLILYTMFWPKREEGVHTLEGHKISEIEIPQTSDSSYTSFGAQLGADVFRDDRLSQFWVKEIIAERTDSDIQRALGGKASTDYRPKLLRPHRSMGEKGTFFIRNNIQIQLFDDKFRVITELQIYYNGYGNNGTLYWGDDYGEVVKDGLEKEPKKTFFGMTYDNHLGYLKLISRIGDVKLTGITQEVPTRFAMDDVINNIVFIKKDEEM